MPISDFETACQTAPYKITDTVQPQLYRSKTFTYNNNPYTFFIRGIKTSNAETDTISLYRKNITVIERQWIEEVKAKPGMRYWELHQVSAEKFTSNVQTDYKSPVDNKGNLANWFWLPITNSDGTSLTPKQIKNDYLLKRTRAQFSDTVCIISNFETEASAKECTLITIATVKSILEVNSDAHRLIYDPNPTRFGVKDIPIQGPQAIGGYGTFKDIYIKLDNFKSEDCYYISVAAESDNNTVTNPYGNSLANKVDNVKNKLRELGVEGI